MDVVDQFLQRRVQSGEREAKIFFNGGEILLRWSLVQDILAHVKSVYPHVKVEYGMNTNATLITDEIAQRLSEFGVQIHVSIDGYRELHDSSRVHHGGAPSFERVMEGIANYNRHNPDRAVTTFQGTIEAVEDFDTSRFTAMADLGFVSARLAPNVLNAAPGRGAAAATWEANVALDTQRERVELDNTYLHKILGKMNQHPTGFSPHCGGLSGNLTSLTLNIDSLQVSQMCSFVSPAALPLSDLEYDIHDSRLWAETYKYMRSRVDMLRDECSGCSVLGHCQGACVYNGLDLANKLNPEGCAYQRTMWRHAVDLSFLGHLRPSGAIVEARGREDGSDGHARSKYIALTPVP